MLQQIEKLMRDYKLDVSAITEYVLCSHSRYPTIKVGIETGNNEGYYVTICDGEKEYALRIHSKDEAMRTLGVMLILVLSN